MLKEFTQKLDQLQSLQPVWMQYLDLQNNRLPNLKQRINEKRQTVESTEGKVHLFNVKLQNRSFVRRNKTTML